MSGVTQRDIADLDGDGNTVEHLLLTPLYDGAFDCVGMLGPAGTVVESYVHTYEGQVTITNATGQTIAASAIGWQQGYGRMYRDDETGLLYGVHRHYSPLLGRFVGIDPAGTWFDRAASGNPYFWCRSQFRNTVDMLGLSPGVQSRDNLDPGHAAQLRADVGVVAAAFESAPLSNFTEDMIEIDQALYYENEVIFLLVPEEELTFGDDWRVLAQTVPYKGRYWVKVSEELMRRSRIERISTLVHELLHVARFKCRGKHHDEGPTVTSSNETLVTFETDVYWIMRRLRHKNPPFRDLIDRKELDSHFVDSEVMVPLR